MSYLYSNREFRKVNSIANKNLFESCWQNILLISRICSSIFSVIALTPRFISCVAFYIPHMCDALSLITYLYMTISNTLFCSELTAGFLKTKFLQRSKNTTKHYIGKKNLKTTTQKYTNHNI